MSDLPLGFRIEVVTRDADTILRNLFEHYLHDMAVWFEFDTKESGAYEFPTGEIWEQGYQVNLLYNGRLPVGFALIGSGEEFVRQAGVNDIDEFFVLRRYRRRGVGRAFATTLFDRMPGDWLVRVFQRNRDGIPFWRSTIDLYTGSSFSETTHTVNGYPWSYFLFRSPGVAG